MTTPQPEKLKALETLVQDICGQHGRLDKLVQQFRQRIEQVEGARDPRVVEGSGEYWRLVAFVDSLVRLRLFLEQNFKYIETMGVLAVTRYVFELTVWLKLLQMDGQYGLVYRCELLKKQSEFYTELQNNAMREVSFLRQKGAQEQDLIASGLAEAMRVVDEDARSETALRLNDRVTQEIDRAASRTFSLYAEQAQTNGYDFQAYLVETKVLPEIGKAIAGLRQELTAFERDTPSDIRKRVPKRWNWKHQAELVHMEKEYDFIYAYASRLLHATPASLTTNQKNLELDEMRMFLKYIRVRLLDVIEMAEELLGNNSSTSH